MTESHRPTIIASGLQSPEAPLIDADGGWLLVEMSQDRGCVTRIDNDRQRSIVCRTGRPNGLARSPDGAVIVAESQLQAVVILTNDDGYRVLTDRDERGGPLLFPNDLCIGADGALYVTDSGLPLAMMRRHLLTSDDPASLPFDGRLYRIDLSNGDIETIEAGLGHLNGVSVGIDSALYVNDTVSGDVYRYPFSPSGLGSRELFANVIDRTLPPTFRGPDGMAHDVEGNLYVTVFNQSEIVVIGTDGAWVDRLRTHGAQPTNLAFGPNEKAIYVTERETGTLQRIETRAPGLRLPGGDGS